MLIYQNHYLKFYLNNNFFKQDDIIECLINIIEEGFFVKKNRKYKNPRTQKYSDWACDFRIPFLKSKNSRIIFPYIANYISNYLGHSTIVLRGHGAFPFIGLGQYENIQEVLLVRENKKQYGFKQEIEGTITPYEGKIIDNKEIKNFNKLYIDQNGRVIERYKEVCVIDDIINSGTVMNKTKELLYNNNFEVSNYFTIFNYKWTKNKLINVDKLHSILEVEKC